MTSEGFSLCMPWHIQWIKKALFKDPAGSFAYSTHYIYSSRKNKSLHPNEFSTNLQGQHMEMLAWNRWQQWEDKLDTLANAIHEKSQVHLDKHLIFMSKICSAEKINRYPWRDCFISSLLNFSSKKHTVFQFALLIFNWYSLQYTKHTDFLIL